MRTTTGRSAVIFDRQPVWLDAVHKLVAGLGVEVVGLAIDADEAVEMVGEFLPHIFIAGIDPASSDELACIRRATRIRPGLKSVVVADSREPEAIEATFRAGASVYCLKTAEQDDLASAIRQTFARSIYMVASESSDSSPNRTAAAEQSASSHLTRRELEILRLVAEGHSNSQLARMLWVTEQTVKFHLSNIYRKLDVANRTEASRWAQLNGLLPSHREEEPEVASEAA